MTDGQRHDRERADGPGIGGAARLAPGGARGARRAGPRALGLLGALLLGLVPLMLAPRGPEHGPGRAHRGSGLGLALHDEYLAQQDVRDLQALQAALPGRGAGTTGPRGMGQQGLRK